MKHIPDDRVVSRLLILMHTLVGAMITLLAVFSIAMCVDWIVFG